MYFIASKNYDSLVREIEENTVIEGDTVDGNR